MAEESWKIILLEESASSNGGTTASSGSSSSQSSNDQKQMAADSKAAAPTWAMAAKFLAPLVGVAGVLAFVIQMMRRSKVFSTFMDSFLTVLSALVDILFIPLIPILAPVLKLFLSFIPTAMAIGKNISEFLKDPWSGMKTIFANVAEWPKEIGNFIGDLFNGMGLTGLGDSFKKAGDILTTAALKVAPIFDSAVDQIQKVWSNSGLNTWQKIEATAKIVWDAICKSAPIMWDAVKQVWTDVISPGIINIVGNIFGKGSTIQQIISDVFKGDFIGAWNTFTAWISSEATKMWNNFKDNTLIPKWNEFYTNTLKPTWEKFVDIAKTLWNAVVLDVEANFKWLIQDIIRPLWDQLLVIVKDLWHNATIDIAATFIDIITKAAVGILNLIPGMGKVIDNMSKAVATQVLGQKVQVPGFDLSNAPPAPGFDNTSTAIQAIADAAKIDAAYKSKLDPQQFEGYIKTYTDVVGTATSATTAFGAAVGLASGSYATNSSINNDHLDAVAKATGGLGDILVDKIALGIQNLINSLSSASSSISSSISTIGRMPTSIMGYSTPLPGYATGLEEVPHDMPVQVHKGERIVPASENKSGDKKLQVQNIFNIQSNDPSLPWKVSKTVTDQVKFSMLRIS
jgi:hypothetical protein